MNNSILDEALAAQQRGWSVMPIRRDVGKLPAVKWKEYQNTAPDEKLIRRWFEKNENRNLGLITGKVSRVFVADTDTQDALDYLISKGIPNGPYVRGSAEFKRHYYFNLPSFEVRNSASKVFAGLDIRGEGGYVVLPPSVHQNGTIYEWIVSPDEMPIPDAPEWLLDELQVPEYIDLSNAPVCLIEPQKRQGHERYAQAGLAAELERVSSAPDGCKHDQLFKSVAAVSEFIPHGFWTESEVEEMFFSAIAPRSKDKEGARKTIRDAIEKGKQSPRRLPEAPMQSRAILLRGHSARAYIGGKSTEYAEAEQEGEIEADGVDEDEKAVNNGLYAILNGRTVLSVDKTKTKETGQDQQSARHFICDFASHIEGEIVDEIGNTEYLIAGRTIAGHNFSLNIAASDMTNPQKMSGLLANVTRSGITTYAGMEKHLGPSIQSFTNRHHVNRIRSFSRTGWTSKGEFIIHGMEPPDVRLQLKKELAYRVILDPTFDCSELLDNLLRAHNSELTTITICYLLLAPLAHLCGWNDEKFALFTTGRSGTFKTSFNQMGMSVYGDFGKDDKLLRFGNGGTVNALMDFPASAADMPLMIDNFKPGTGSGQRDAQTLVHGLLEGTEKKRLTKDGKQRDTKEFRCWLVLTGEETVNDAASVARMLILNAVYDSNENDKLTWCQTNSHLLPHIGGSWISWLQEGGASEIIKSEVKHFGDRRGEWTRFLRRSNAEMVNAMRVATSLTLCQTAWNIASHHPVIGPVLKRWRPQFDFALKGCAGGMADASANSHEAVRFLESLRAMIEGGKGYLAERYADANPENRATFLGWKDDNFVYLHPQLSMNAALDFLKNQNGLNGIGLPTISKQLNQLKYLATTDGSNMAVKKKMGTEGRPRVFIIPYDKFFDGSNSSETDE